MPCSTKAKLKRNRLEKLTAKLANMHAAALHYQRGIDEGETPNLNRKWLDDVRARMAPLEREAAALTRWFAK